MAEQKDPLSDYAIIGTIVLILAGVAASVFLT